MPVDTRDSEIIEDVRLVLEGLTDDGGPLFPGGVFVVHSPEHGAGVYSQAAGPVAAVVGGRSQRGPATDNSEQYVARLELPVVVRVQYVAAPGDDVSEAVAQVNRMVDLVREGLLADRTRGGRAGLIEFGGRVINGTSADGEPRWIRAGKDKPAMLAAVIPIVCGWSKAA